MNVFFKLCFDLGCYLSVIVYYGSLKEVQPPFLPALLLLFASAALDGAWSSLRKPSKLLRGVLPLLVIGGCLLARPTRTELLRIAPFLIYHLYAMHSGRISADEDGFLRSCRFAAAVMPLLLLPGILFLDRFTVVLEAAAPYLCMSLFSAIALNRLLRLHGEAKGKELLLLLLFAALCSLCAVIRLPSLLWQGVVLLWSYILQPIVSLLLLLLGLLLYGLFWFFNLIFKTDGDPFAMPNLTVESAAEQMGMEELAEEVQASPWIRILLYALGIALLSVLLWRFFHRFIGSQTQEEAEEDGSAERELPPPRPPLRFGLIRPANPRDAVRFYFDKFLREARRRGANIRASMTGEELVAAAAKVFPEADPEELRQIWLPARYSSAAVSREEAAAAAAVWKKLKKSS